MTKKEVLALYPQFAVPGYRSWVRNGDGVYLLVYPTVPEPEWGRYILLRFDENQILEEMTLGFNIAN